MRSRIALSCLAATLVLAAPLSARAEEESTVALARSNNAFALELYRELAEGAAGDNLFLSPASVSTALAMTYAGARGTTAEEMRSTLHWEQEGDDLHAAMAALTDSLGADEPGHRLSIANALWGQQGYDFLDEFVARGERYYGAGLQRVDFVKATEEARTTINRWVAERTNDRIRDLLAPGVLTPLTRLVLTNAIYFKGTWEEMFDEEWTRPEPFHLADGGSVQVPMMRHLEARFPYLFGDGFQALELPYAGEAASMVVFLPARDSDLSTFERRLTGAQVEAWIARLRPRRLDVVTLPRFKMTSKFDLAATLGAMGMPSAFRSDADFSGMTGKRDLFLSNVIHEAFVEVNEEGTEAAAATGVLMKRTAVMNPIEFRADRPFFFVIRDRSSGALLFVGRVTRPAEGA